MFTGGRVLKERITGALLVMLLIIAICIPQSAQASLKKRTTYSDKQKSADQTTAAQSNTTAASQPAPVVLVLDAGHGGVDSGAKGNGFLEKNMTLAIVLSAKQYFDKDKRFKVYYTRIADTYPSLKDRSKLANKNKADLFICVHINSAHEGASGTETLYSYPRNISTMKNGISSADLAGAMQKTALRSTGFADRGLVNRPGLYVLKHTKMPACLIEYGFISNPIESRIMEVNKTRYGKELYEGIVEYMKSKGRIK